MLDENKDFGKAGRVAEVLEGIGWECYCEVCERGGAQVVVVGDLYNADDEIMPYGYGLPDDAVVPYARRDDGQAWIDALAALARRRTAPTERNESDDECEEQTARVARDIAGEFQPALDALADEFGAQRRECLDPEAPFAVVALAMGDLREAARRIERDGDVEAVLGSFFAERFATDFRELYPMLAAPERGRGTETDGGCGGSDGAGAYPSQRVRAKLPERDQPDPKRDRRAAFGLMRAR